MRYMLNISDEEKKSLLDQHKQPYNGYQTLQLQQPDNRISVYDPAGDKKGVQVTANGGVRTYSNFNLRESKGETCECGGMMYEGECMECGKMYESDVAKLQDEFDYVAEGEMCEECGSGMMYEGECNECGYTVKNPEPMYSQGFEYMNESKYMAPAINPEMGEEVSASLQEPYSEIDFDAYDFDSGGPEQFEPGDKDENYGFSMKKQQDVLDYVSQHDNDPDARAMLNDLEKAMNNTYDGKEELGGEWNPYEFDSEGPMNNSGVFREMEDPEEIEKVKESIQESLKWFKRFSKFN